MRIKDKQKEASIVRATLELTEARGLAGIKMTALARRAGVATGTLYTYYKDKQELLLAVYDSVWDNSLTYTGGTDTVGDDTESVLRHFVLSYARFIVENRAAIVFIEQMKHSPFLTPDATQYLLDRYQPLVNVIETGIADGLLKPAHPHELLYVLEGIIKSIVNHDLSLNGQVEADTGERCWAYVWRAVKE